MRNNVLSGNGVEVQKFESLAGAVLVASGAPSKPDAAAEKVSREDKKPGEGSASTQAALNEQRRAGMGKCEKDPVPRNP